jgi:hypothetical protein
MGPPYTIGHPDKPRKTKNILEKACDGAVAEGRLELCPSLESQIFTDLH